MSARTDQGFTLLELLVVLAIISAIAAAFPLALNRFVPARRVDAAARILLADIRLAQARAVIMDRPVVLEASAHGYHIGADVMREWNPSTSLALHSADGAQPIDSLRLFPDGSTNGAQLVISDGQRMRSVRVSPLTGRVLLERPS